MTTDPIGPDPDHAWKTLTLVNDWIKHADTKVAATLAATTATALALYNLLANEKHPNIVFLIAAVGCATLLLWTARCALQALAPRVRSGKKSDPEEFDSLLFYRHIAHIYPYSKKSSYVHALGELTMDNQALTKQIAEQVHANAAVANAKFGWVNKAIWALALALAFLAVTAVAAIWKDTPDHPPTTPKSQPTSEHASPRSIADADGNVHSKVTFYGR